MNTYDFPSEAECKATPYGVYDAQANQAFVSVGISATTAQFAVATLCKGWTQLGVQRYRNAHHLIIEADAGGCNGHRPRLWKQERQPLVNDTGLNITVMHYPSGASKWNPIEHRLFSQISRNWAGYPLRSLNIMLSFIRGTTTSTNLTVAAELDKRIDQKGIKIMGSALQVVIC